eukprot:4416956-Amphidinium_carterae.1
MVSAKMRLLDLHFPVAGRCVYNCHEAAAEAAAEKAASEPTRQQTERGSGCPLAAVWGDGSCLP